MTLWQNKACKYSLGLFLLLAYLSACVTANYITIEGKIAVKGNEPFTFLSISNNKVEYQITGKLEEQIRSKYQGQVVTLKGLLIKDSKQKSFLQPAQLNVSVIVSVEKTSE